MSDEVREIALVMLDEFESMDACPWCAPDRERRRYVKDHRTFHFDEGCLLLELLDLASGAFPTPSTSRST